MDYFDETLSRFDDKRNRNVDIFAGGGFYRSLSILDYINNSSIAKKDSIRSCGFSKHMFVEDENILKDILTDGKSKVDLSISELKTNDFLNHLSITKDIYEEHRKKGRMLAVSFQIKKNSEDSHGSVLNIDTSLPYEEFIKKDIRDKTKDNQHMFFIDSSVVLDDYNLFKKLNIPINNDYKFQITNTCYLWVACLIYSINKYVKEKTKEFIEENKLPIDGDDNVNFNRLTKQQKEQLQEFNRRLFLEVKQQTNKTREGSEIMKEAINQFCKYIYVMKYVDKDREYRKKNIFFSIISFGIYEAYRRNKNKDIIDKHIQEYKRIEEKLNEELKAINNNKDLNIEQKIEQSSKKIDNFIENDINDELTSTFYARNFFDENIIKTKEELNRIRNHYNKKQVEIIYSKGVYLTINDPDYLMNINDTDLKDENKLQEVLSKIKYHDDKFEGFIKIEKNTKNIETIKNLIKLTKQIKENEEWDSNKELNIVKCMNINNKELNITCVYYGLMKGHFRNGKCKYYSYNGKLEFEGEYLNGERNGKGKEYCDGELAFEGEYLNGERNGKGKEYCDGELAFEGEYLNGERKKGKLYNIDGNIVFEGDFINRYPYCGERRFYDSNNELEFVCEVIDGYSRNIKKVTKNETNNNQQNDVNSKKDITRINDCIDKLEEQRKNKKSNNNNSIKQNFLP